MPNMPPRKRVAEEVDTVSISEFKAKCLGLLDRVKRTGRPLLITRRGEPIAEVFPPPPARKEQSWLGSAATTCTILGDLVAPVVAEDEWEVLRS